MVRPGTDLMRGQADVEAVGYLLVDKAADHEAQHFDLAGGQFMLVGEGGSRTGHFFRLRMAVPMAEAVQL